MGLEANLRLRFVEESKNGVVPVAFSLHVVIGVLDAMYASVRGLFHESQ
jgi:hypothetical protein